MSVTLAGPVECLVNRMVPRVIAALPDGVKRLLNGGGSITIDGNTLDPTLQLLLTIQRASGGLGMVVNDDAEATRERARKLSIALAGPSARVEASDLVIPGPAGPIPARRYQPPMTGPTPMVVYYHGGGFVFGGIETHDGLCRQICRDGAVQVLSIDYRLAPEHRAPAAADDAYAAYRWSVEDLGVRPGSIAVAGDSAGGALAAIVSQMARLNGDPLPALQWLIYPVTELGSRTRSRRVFKAFPPTQHDTDWFDRQYLEGSGLSAADPLVSPLRAEDLSGLPPALVITAGFDPLRDEGRQYATTMQAAGVVVDHREMDSLTHSFVNFGSLRGACAAGIAESISAMRAHLSRT
jgi:acetyl esterase/lipase